MSNLWEAIGLQTFIALDLETTGLDPSSCGIIELGAVRIENGREVDRFSQLVNPLVPLPREITKLTGITEDDLNYAPLLEKAAHDYIDFVGDLPIVGHHVAFDLGFLSDARPTSDHFKKSRTIPITHDTSPAARFANPCLNSYGLKNLSRHFVVSTRPNHRACDDASATAELFVNLIELLITLPREQLAQAFHFVEGTASPLANTLRNVLKISEEVGASDYAIANNHLLDLQVTDNVFTCEGDQRPESAVNEIQLDRFFREEDRFKGIWQDYEVRQEQRDMANEVARAFRDEEILVVEAGTGVGKSMGYLVPALLSGKRIVISSHTKNLQDQLFNQEIPRLGSLFKFGFKVALLKGRRNYLCRTKWKNWAINPERGAPNLREMAATSVRWAKQTITGDLDELMAVGNNPAFYSLISSEPGYCSTQTCLEQQLCPLVRIRRISQTADIVIVNHSLVLSDLANEANLLGEDELNIILDEAHHFEDVTTDQFGVEVSARSFRAALDRIKRFCGRKSEICVTMLSKGKYEREVGLLQQNADMTSEIQTEADKFFTHLRHEFRSGIPDNPSYSTAFKFKSGDKYHIRFSEMGLTLEKVIGDLITKLKNAVSRVAPLVDDVIPEHLLLDVKSAIQELDSVHNTLELIMLADREDQVYWVDFPADIDKAISLKAAPLDVASILEEYLWDRITSAVLTSATLATGSGDTGFDHLVRRLGLDRGQAHKLVVSQYGSPFDYDKNCRLIFPSFLPPPVGDQDEYLRGVSEICSGIALEHRKKILVLFTSYKAMRSVNYALASQLAGENIDLYVQSGARRRSSMLYSFANNENAAILMGTYSFWEGIDLPGDAVQIVIIPKLPFDVPNDPVVSARIEQLKAEGENAFSRYQLPNAVLRTRQGAGRLIRTTTDRGIVMILDSRIISKSYGSSFRKMLQGKSMIANSSDELEQCVEKFFSD